MKYLEISESRLREAVEGEFNEFVAGLVEEGRRRKESPYDCALEIMGGDVDVVRRRVQDGGDVDVDEALHLASVWGRVEIAEYLVGAGAGSDAIERALDEVNALHRRLGNRPQIVAMRDFLSSAIRS